MIFFFFLFFCALAFTLGHWFFLSYAQKGWSNFTGHFQGKRNHTQKWKQQCFREGVPRKPAADIPEHQGSPCWFTCPVCTSAREAWKVWLAFSAFLTDLTQEGQDRAAPGKATHSASCQQGGYFSLQTLLGVWRSSRRFCGDETFLSSDWTIWDCHKENYGLRLAFPLLLT